MRLQREAARDKLHADLVTVRVFSHARSFFKVNLALQVGRPVMQRASGSFVEVIINIF
jgi:hypothetical protein